MSISLVFSERKPCCTKKAKKNAVSCKFNHVIIETDKDILGELTTEDSESSLKTFKCNTASGSKCAKSCTKKPWWKFWAKKFSKNCPCKQVDDTETDATKI